jgi:AdoMet-dependent rRNA methyltransferase SPB1
MGKKTKLGASRLDKFYHLAKEQGYRSRAAYKLIQLNKKHNFLGKAQSCVDLCAAPGGWLQVCAKYMPQGSKIIGVDLVPIKPIKNVIGLTSDITTETCRQLIRRELGNTDLDVVLNDGAPNVGGAWTKDAYSQSELTLHALKLAVDVLKMGGMFITKVFRSQDYNSLIWACKQFFKQVEATKPMASRNTSAEIFVVCHGFLAPKKIDPKVLDPKFVFGDVESDMMGSQQKPDIFNKKQSVRNRQGYAEGDTLLAKDSSVKEFVECENPVRLLTDFNSLVFDEESKEAGYDRHRKTTHEVKACCVDLRVLGKTDFKNLLKWRLVLRAELDEARELEANGGVKPVKPEKPADAREGGMEEKDMDEALADEMEDRKVLPCRPQASSLPPLSSEALSSEDSSSLCCCCLSAFSLFALN